MFYMRIKMKGCLMFLSILLALFFSIDLCAAGSPFSNTRENSPDKTNIVLPEKTDFDLAREYWVASCAQHDLQLSQAINPSTTKTSPPASTNASPKTTSGLSSSPKQTREFVWEWDGKGPKKKKCKSCCEIL